MTMLMVIYSGSHPQVVTTLLEAHAVRGWTELPRALGAGTTGRREATRAWPGDAAVFFTVVDRDRALELIDALEAAAHELPAGERLHAALLPVERFF